jgi:ferric-chelate reductase [NAD(P)H]
MDRSALHSISYGVYVVTTGDAALRNGQICNTVFQVTSDPAAMAISINKLNYTHECLGKTGVFAVSVLTEAAPMTFIGRFGFKCGRDFDKLEGLDVRTGVTGCPVVADHAAAFIECRITADFDCGTHTLFLGTVEDAGMLGQDPPMTYTYYHLVKKGKSPSRAPTFIAV